MNTVLIFLALMVPGTFLLGVNDVFVRRLLRSGKIDEQMLLAFEFITTGILVAIPLFIFGIPELKPGFWFAAGATTALNVIAQWAWYAAFKREEASLISPLRLITPPLVIISGYFILQETVSIGGVVGILTTVFGLWLLIKGEADEAGHRLRDVLKRPGVSLGIFGALLFAISLPFDKMAVTNSSALFTVVVVFLALGVSSFLIAAFRRRMAFDAKEHWLLLVLMPFVHGGASVLTFAALNYSLAAYAASVKRLWSFWAVLLSGRFLKEKNIGRKLLATVVMLLGLAVTVFFG